MDELKNNLMVKNLVGGLISLYLLFSIAKAFWKFNGVMVWEAWKNPGAALMDAEGKRGLFELLALTAAPYFVVFAVCAFVCLSAMEASLMVRLLLASAIGLAVAAAALFLTYYTNIHMVAPDQAERTTWAVLYAGFFGVAFIWLAYSLWKLPALVIAAL